MRTRIPPSTITALLPASCADDGPVAAGRLIQPDAAIASQSPSTTRAPVIT